MTFAFKAKLHSTHKFVLVALCDNANDQGECFPSISMLCEKTSLSERAVQGSISYLVSEKFIRRDVRAGRSTYYYIADPRTWCTPAGYAPPQDMHPTPARGAPQPPQDMHPTPARGAPITIIEPSIEPSVNHKAALVKKSFVLPSWIPVEAWNGYLEMRKKIRKMPTDRAVDLVVATLERIRDAGHDVGVALDKSTANNWVDVYMPKQDKNHASMAGSTNGKLGKAGQETADAGSRLREKMRAENGR